MQKLSSQEKEIKKLNQENEQSANKEVRLISRGTMHK